MAQSRFKRRPRGEPSITFTCLGKKKPSISQSHFVWMSSTRCVTLPENTIEGQTARHDSNIHDVVFRRRSFPRPKVERSHSRRQKENINNIFLLFFFTEGSFFTGTATRTKSKCSKIVGHIGENRPSSPLLATVQQASFPGFLLAAASC